MEERCGREGKGRRIERGGIEGRACDNGVEGRFE